MTREAFIKAICERLTAALKDDHPSDQTLQGPLNHADVGRAAMVLSELAIEAKVLR
jgi:hypothetical protein